MGSIASVGRQPGHLTPVRNGLWSWSVRTGVCGSVPSGRSHWWRSKKTLRTAGDRPADGRREIVMSKVAEVGPRLGVQATCEVLGVSRASYYRWHKP